MKISSFKVFFLFFLDAGQDEDENEDEKHFPDEASSSEGGSLILV